MIFCESCHISYATFLVHSVEVMLDYNDSEDFLHQSLQPIFTFGIVYHMHLPSPLFFKENF